MNAPHFPADLPVQLERLHIESGKCRVCQSWNLFLIREELFVDPALHPRYDMTRHDPAYAKWRFIRKTRETWYFQLLDEHVYSDEQGVADIRTPVTMPVPTDYIPELNSGAFPENDDDGKWCNCR